MAVVTESNRHINIATIKCVARVQHKCEYQQEYGLSESQTLSRWIACQACMQMPVLPNVRDPLRTTEVVT